MYTSATRSSFMASSMYCMWPPSQNSNVPARGVWRGGRGHIDFRGHTVWSLHFSTLLTPKSSCIAPVKRVRWLNFRLCGKLRRIIWLLWSLNMYWLLTYWLDWLLALLGFSLGQVLSYNWQVTVVFIWFITTARPPSERKRGPTPKMGAK